MKRHEPKRRMQRGEFRVDEFQNPSGEKAYRVYGWLVKGSGFRARVRENYKTHDEALARMQQLEIEADNLEGAARPVVTRLTPEQAAEAEAAFKELDGKPLLPAIRYFLDNYREPVAEVKLLEAITPFRDWLDACQLRPHSKKNLRNRVSAFVNSMPGARVADVTPETIDGYLSSRAVSAKSKDNDRRAISRFFAWCMGYEGEDVRSSRRWTEANPCHREKRGRRKRDEARPHILNVEQCKALMDAAVNHKGGVIVPYVAVCLFGGLRPFESQRLTWKAVNLADNEILLEGTTTKTGETRVVAIGETLRAWLNDYKGKPFLPENWRRELDAVKEAAGLVTRETAKSTGTVQKRKNGKLVNARHYWKRIVPVAWAPDILRHTAASHYFRQTGSYGQTAEQFGNSEAIIKRHYQGLVRSEDTKAFFSILPAAAKAEATRSRKIITLATQPQTASKAQVQTVAVKA